MKSELIFYDPLIEPGSERHHLHLGNVRYVTAQDYYRVQVGHVMNILAVFMNLSASGVPAGEQGAVDDAIADEYWNRYKGCLIPPRVMRELAAESNGADALASIVEQARRKLVTPEVALDDAITERIRLRVGVLKAGIDGALSDRQLAIAEVIIDMFLLERAAMEDVIMAEREREPGQTRASVIEQMDAEEALVFETALPVIIRPEMIRKAIPASMQADLQALTAARTPYFVKGVFAD